MGFNMKKYNISDFGALSDGTLQTKKIQRAIDECFLSGGGIVIIPCGEYLTGGIRLRSNVTLYLKSGAVLKASRNPDDYFSYKNDKIEPLPDDKITDAPYVHLSTIKGETKYEENKSEYRFKRIPGSRWNNAIIRTIDAENVAIIGEKDSVIDGDNCYDAQGEEDYRGPHGLTLFNTKNIKLSGYTIQNCGNWAHNLLFCDNIEATGITVLAGHDGFDAAVCNNLKIADSSFYTGDDCIAGFGNMNVFVSDCVMNSACSAMRFGGTNVIVEKCRMFGPCKYYFRGSLSDEEKRSGSMSAKKGRNNMLSAFTYYADYSLPIKEQPGNIIIKNCKIENAGKLLHYNYSETEIWQKNRPLSDITFENVNISGVSLPIILRGSEEVPVYLTLKNVNADVGDNGVKLKSFINAQNFGAIRMDKFCLKNFKGLAVILKNTDGEVRARDVNVGNTAIEEKTDKAFEIKAI